MVWSGRQQEEVILSAEGFQAEKVKKLRLKTDSKDLYFQVKEQRNVAVETDFEALERVVALLGAHTQAQDSVTGEGTWLELKAEADGGPGGVASPGPMVEAGSEAESEGLISEGLTFCQGLGPGLD